MTAGTKRRVSVSHALALAEHGVRVAPTVQQRQVAVAIARLADGQATDADARMVFDAWARRESGVVADQRRGS